MAAAKIGIPGYESIDYEGAAEAGDGYAAASLSAIACETRLPYRATVYRTGDTAVVRLVLEGSDNVPEEILLCTVRAVYWKANSP